MNEAIVSAALKTLNIDAESVSGELTDEQIKEFTDKINQLKVYQLRNGSIHDLAKQGEDYQNAIELIDRIVDNRVKTAGNPDETLTKELTTLREALKAKEEEKNNTITSIESEYKKSFFPRIFLFLEKNLCKVVVPCVINDQCRSS